MSADRAHAILSASGASRWLNCTPSAQLEERFPDGTSSYAEEGTLAHAIAELRLRKHFTEPMGARTFNNRLKKLQEHPLYQAEMLSHTEAYLDYCKKLAMSYKVTPVVSVERRLDFSRYVPDGFGTGDCVVIGSGVLHIIDFKYGRGVPVSAEDNPQMKLYALGALAHYGLFFQIDTVKMTIFQPRIDNVSEWETTQQALRDWGENTVKPLAERAMAGQGEFVPGDWCRFCRAKAVCRARSDSQTALEVFGGRKPPLLSNAEVGDVLCRSRALVDWVNSLEEYALAELLAGREIAGWKAVEGRSNRQFTDQEAAFKELITLGYDEALLYERKPITMTAVEKLVGKSDFAEKLGNFIIKPQGKPTIAPQSDAREPYRVHTRQPLKRSQIKEEKR